MYEVIIKALQASYAGNSSQTVLMGDETLIDVIMATKVFKSHAKL